MTQNLYRSLDFIERTYRPKLFCIVKKRGWTIFSLIRTSSRKRKKRQKCKTKKGRYVISRRPTLGVKIKRFRKNIKWRNEFLRKILHSTLIISKIINIFKINIENFSYKLTGINPDNHLFFIWLKPPYIIAWLIEFSIGVNMSETAGMSEFLGMKLSLPSKILNAIFW